MKTKQSFFEKRSVVAVFGVVALLAGFLFLNTGVINPFTGKVTGNFVSSGETFGVNLISIIGLLLIVSSAILIVYAIVKKE